MMIRFRACRNCYTDLMKEFADELTAAGFSAPVDVELSFFSTRNKVDDTVHAKTCSLLKKQEDDEGFFS